MKEVISAIILAVLYFFFLINDIHIIAQQKPQKAVKCVL